jgi:putative aminopeptidase FrvX
VGDRSSIFNPGVTKFISKIAAELGAREKGFKFQRKLMDGGTCETTAYQAFGYTAGAACVPLGNYHNRDVSRRRIAAEYVSISDMESMVKLFVEMVRKSGSISEYIEQSPPDLVLKKLSLGERFFVRRK